MTSAKISLFLKIWGGSKKRQKAPKRSDKDQIAHEFRANYWFFRNSLKLPKSLNLPTSLNLPFWTELPKWRPLQSHFFWKLDDVLIRDKKHQNDLIKTKLHTNSERITDFFQPRWNFRSHWSFQRHWRFQPHWTSLFRRNFRNYVLLGEVLRRDKKRQNEFSPKLRKNSERITDFLAKTHIQTSFCPTTF